MSDDIKTQAFIINTSTDDVNVLKEIAPTIKQKVLDGINSGDITVSEDNKVSYEVIYQGEV